MIILGVLEKDNSYNCLRYRGKQAKVSWADENKMTNRHICLIYQNQAQCASITNQIYCTEDL